MNILHINSDFCFGGIYKHLYKSMQDADIEHIIYSSVNKAHEQYCPDILNNSNQETYIGNILTPLSRKLYFPRIMKSEKDIMRRINLQDIHLTHAHFAMTDGGVAYLLKRHYDIPYITSVRGTDINIYYKYCYYLRPVFKHILLGAERIVFISPAHSKFVCDNIIKVSQHDIFKSKQLVIGNGIDSFWLQNKLDKPKALQGDIRLLYVGKFVKNKNLFSIIHAASHLHNQGLNVCVTMVGDGPLEGKLKALAIQSSIPVNIYDHIADKNTLLQIYRNSNLYIMPSFSETFGVSYLEAMSQGLPCIYSKGQGIDGVFNEGVIGYGVDPHDTYDIANKIALCVEGYSHKSENCLNEIDKYNWDAIGNQYKALYNDTF